MFKIKEENGRNNICGTNIKEIRERESLSQRQLSVILQNAGYDLDHYAIRRIENGERFVTDIELTIFAEVFHVSFESLLCRQ